MDRVPRSPDYGPAAESDRRVSLRDRCAGAIGPVGGGRRALVVFSGQTDLGWLRLLKPSFRHCFVAVEADDGWVVVNPLCHVTEIAVVRGVGRDALAAGYRKAGLIVVATRTHRPPPRPAPWRPFSCVETVRRILGLEARWVLTPWQLFRHIQGHEEKKRRKSLTLG